VLDLNRLNQQRFTTLVLYFIKLSFYMIVLYSGFGLDRFHGNVFDNLITVSFDNK